ncbi:PorP/SprF family type IX secretion system membrane protein [Ulvibacter antarcticus]|uniref:Type IX secretion system PorP/SprF family membrane protein n=1 Tax=Ulvibacter antarcticus TaxID=442714 RepID=A0A3L9YVE8_9FLAO|nr:type IX secretion system membrane protein PorP/SprF [Ulvibacter antarcticus]RMA64721.1 type IX secretion system PorP/SprF family membrane protein [Ulvibacter antarcticus]
MKNNLLKIKYLCIIGLIAFSQLCHAQQDPQYTQYMYNMSVVNPAYATDDLGIVNFGLLHRTQWVGAVGGPKSYSFFGHLPVNDKIEMGLSFISDNIGEGVLNEHNIYGDFAYKLQLDDKGKHLSLGLKAGVTLFKTDFNGFNLESGTADTDIAFGPGQSRTFPNLGIGAYFFSHNYYIGLSAPNLLNSKHLEEQDGLARLGSEEIHSFLTAGYVLAINENYLLKPSTMIRAVSNSPFMIDVSLNMLCYQRVEGGVSYRFDDSVSGMLNFKVTPDLKIGYAYDHTLTNFGNYNSGSHEIFVLFDLDLMSLTSGFDKSPRFF